MFLLKQNILRLKVFFLILFISVRAANCQSSDSLEFNILLSPSEKNKPFDYDFDNLNIHFTYLDSTEFSRTDSILRLAFEKYPTPFLNKHINNIYVLDSIIIDNVNYGGTNYKNDIYLTNRGIQHNYSNLFIEKLFHAEFSSILYKLYTDEEFEANWMYINPSNFSYLGTGIEAINLGHSETPSDSISAYGFLSEYAMSSMENDFNSIAKNLFTNDPNLWTAINNHTQIKNKVVLFIEFYNRLNPIFTLAYFENI